MHPLGPGAVPRTLRAGGRLRFSAAGVGPALPFDPDGAAWVDGMLVASGMRLADFLAELERHRPGRLRCDPGVAGLRVSGSYPLADTGRILDALAATLGLEIRFLSRYWVSLGRAALALGNPVELSAIAGADHFSVIHGLEDPSSPVCRWLHRQLTS